jgi:hypothetical protein
MSAADATPAFITSCVIAIWFQAGASKNRNPLDHKFEPVIDSGIESGNIPPAL